MQKAMGWALRDYSRTDPDEVCRYVDAMGPALPRLTQREACKHLG